MIGHNEGAVNTLMCYRERCWAQMCREGNGCVWDRTLQTLKCHHLSFPFFVFSWSFFLWNRPNLTPHQLIKIRSLCKDVKWWCAWMKRFSNAVSLASYQLPGYRVQCSPLDPRDLCHWFTNEKLGENRRFLAVIGELVVNRFGSLSPVNED